MPEISQKLGFDTKSATASLAGMTKHVNQLNASLTSLKAKGGGAGIVNTKGLASAKKQVNSLTVSWQTMARVVQTQIAIRGLNAIIEGLKEGVQQAKELGLAIEEVQTISGRRVDSGTLQQQVLNLSDQLGKPAQDLAEGLYQTLSNQVVEAGESMNFLATASKLATVTASETKDAVNALSSVMNSYGLEAEQSTHIADTLFKTVELGRLRLSEIANVIGRVTPLTAAMGVEWEEAAAAIAVMTRQGVKADTAITQLRAIMTKIIRPTEEMREIFHKWGVEDGKQAIETFGGLRGVLVKLGEETGGSSEAMADLLRRVRTIVGQLSLMNDGGLALADTMGQIKNATGEVASQWDQFTASDAFKLQQSTNELNNTLTELGTKILPLVGAGFAGLNDFIDSQTAGWKTILGLYDDAAVNREVNSRRAKTLAEEEEKRNEEFAKNQKERFDGLTDARAKYYAAARSEEFKLEADRDAAVGRANKVIQEHGKDIVKFYKDSTKELGSFIDTINDRIKSNTQKIADVNSQIQQRELDQRLSRETSAYGKLQVLEAALSSARRKASQAFQQVDSSKESVARAIAENKSAIALSKQLESLAAQSGHTRTIQKAQATTNTLLKNQVDIYEQSSRNLEAAGPQAEALYKTRLDSEKKLQQLMKSRNELYETGQLASGDPKVKAEAERQLADINAQLNNIITDAARGDAFFKSLGLDTNLPKLTSAMTQALDDAHKDWDAEVSLAKDAFSDFQIQVKAALDPTGLRGALAEGLGLKKSDKQTESSFQRDVDAKALAALKEQLSLENSIANLQDKHAAQLQANAGLLEKANAQNKVRVEAIRAAFNAAEKLLVLGGQWAQLQFDSAENQKKVNQEFVKTVDANIGGIIRLQKALQQMEDASQRGVVLTKENIEARRQELEVIKESGTITASQANTYEAIIDSLQDAATTAKDLQEANKNLLPESTRQLARELEEKLRGGADASTSMEEAAKQFNSNLQQSDGAVNQLRGSIQGTKQDFDTSAQSANTVTQSTSQIGSAAAAQVAGVNSLTEAYRRLARAAAAAPSGGARAYHGGPMARYFAAGGVARGQDTISTMLSRDETVVNAKNSKRFFSELNAMNQGSTPVYREQGGPVTNVGDVNVTVNGGESSQQTVREIGHALRREIQRGNVKLR